MNGIDSIIEEIEENRDAAVMLLKALVSVDTVVPPGNNYEKCTGIVSDYLRNMGCRVTQFKAPNKYMERSGAGLFDPPLSGPRPNVVARFGNGNGKSILFNGHLDIVPVGPGWTKDPFGELVDGVFYGRGSGDNKGGVVSMIVAAKAILDAGVALNGSVILTATVDEEIGGIGGLGAIIEEGLIQADYGISCDGDQESISISNQGRFKGRIITEGVAVHSSRAQDGVNAIEKMAKIVLALQAHGRALRERSTRIPAPPSTGRKFVYPTTNVGTIRGGLKENIVPDYCAITFNRRVTPEESLEGARAEYLSVVEKAVADDPQAKWRYEEMNTREPSLTRLDDPFVIRFRKVAENILGREVPIYGGLGGNDACFMRNRLNIPVVQFGAAREDSKAHGTDEHIRIDDLLNASKVYASIVMELLGSG